MIHDNTLGGPMVRQAQPEPCPLARRSSELYRKIFTFENLPAAVFDGDTIGQLGMTPLNLCLALLPISRIRATRAKCAHARAKTNFVSARDTDANTDVWGLEGVTLNVFSGHSGPPP